MFVVQGQAASMFVVMKVINPDLAVRSLNQSSQGTAVMGCSLRVTDRAAADAHRLKVPMKPQCMSETDLNIFAAPAFEPHSAGVNSPHGADADRFWPSAWRRW